MGLKNLGIGSFIRNAKEMESSHPIIQLTIGRLSPTCKSINLMYNQLDMSYAFDKSRFMTIARIFFVFIECNLFCVALIASCMFVPSTNPNYSNHITCNNLLFTLTAMIFAIILYIQLHKDIDLKSSKVYGLSFSRMNVGK
jgi:hypothetical protein